MDEDKITTIMEHLRQQRQQVGKQDAFHTIVFNFIEMGLSLEQIVQTIKLPIVPRE